LLFLAGLSIYKNRQAPDARAGWFNDHWHYRKKVAITNSGGTELTDFQVSLELDTASLISANKMQADCDDIRITDINGKILPHWVEENMPGCNASATKIWFKHPSIAATGANIYVYYGNESAVNTESGNDVFLFFDDFSKYNGWSGDVSNFATATDGSRTVLKVDGSATPGEIFKEINVSASYVVEIALRDTDISSNSPHPGLLFASNGTTSDYYGFYIRGLQDQVVEAHDGGWGSFADSISIDNNWHTYKATINNGVLETLYFDNTTALNAFANWTITTSHSHIGLWSHSSQADGFFDSLFIRQYTATEPVAGTPASEEVGPAPIAEWKFDEGTGTTAHDSSGNHNGTLTSDPSWQPEDMCISGKCLQFDGVDDYVSAGVGSDYLPMDEFSICTWIRSNGLASDMTKSGIVSITYGLLLELDGSGNFRTYMDNGTSLIAESITQNLYDDRWHYLCLSYDGTDRHMYIDGKNRLIAATTWTGTTRWPTNGFSIGHNNNNPPLYKFNGFIDEVKIYPYARTDEEIKADYNAGAASAGSSAVIGSPPTTGGQLSEGLVGYWKMDEASWTNDCSTATVLDSSGNGNNGTACPATTGPTSGGIGKFGNGGSFDGSDDYAQLVSNTESILETNPDEWSYSIWFKSGASTGKKTLIANYDSATGDSTVGVWAGLNAASHVGDVYISIRGTDAPDYLYTDGTHDYNDGAWHHLMVTAKKGESVNGYIDDQPFASGSLGTNDYIDTAPLRLGALRYNDTISEFFDGSIDEVRIYNRALSASEVRNLYNWAPGPVAYWAFDSSSGTTIPDISGNNNDLTWTGTSPTLTTGKFGKSIEVLGGTDYYYINSFNNLNNAPLQFTVAYWIQPLELSNYNQTLRAMSDWPGFVIHTNEDGAMWAGIDDDDGVWDSRFDASDMPAGTMETNKWQHFTFTYNNGAAAVYKNGIKLVSKTGMDLTDNWNGFQIGYNSDPDNINGMVDEVRIYNYARTPSQIIEDMNAGHPMGGSPIGSQLAYWKFDEGYGGTAHDSGPHGYDGTISGASWSNEGKIGKTLSFDGTDDAIYLNYDYSNSYFIGSLWFKLNSLNTQQTLLSLAQNIGAGSAQDRTAYVDITNTNKITLGVWVTDPSSQWTSITGNTTLQSDTWYHLYWSFTDKDNYEIYLNGQLEASNNGHSYSAISKSSAPYRAYIGSSFENDALMYPTHGLIDEVKIYSTALTEDQIKLDYNQGKSVVYGATGTEADGAPSFSADRSYCPPGDTTAACGPIAEWKLDEKTGTTAYDSSGNENNGTLTNMATDAWKSSAQCKIGACLQFDGVEDYVAISHSSVFNSNNQSISAWFKGPSSTISNHKGLVYKAPDTGFNREFGLELEASTCYGIFSVFNGTDDSSGVIIGTTNLCDGNWHQAVGIKKYSASGDTYELYVDGILEASTTVSYNGVQNSNEIVIGKLSSSSFSTRYFAGFIDHVQLYNYALTPAQIAWNYNRGAPVGWWKFDEGEGTTAYDSSGNENNGTLTNMDPSTDYVSGKINTALEFNGVDDYVAISSYEAPSEVTMSLWMYESGSSSSQAGILYSSNPSDATGDWGIRYNGTNIVKFRDYHGGIDNLVTIGEIIPNKWEHIVAVISGTSFIPYINGEQQTPVTLTQNHIARTLNNLRVGHLGNYSASQYFFSGSINDVRIYNYALTEQQIQQIYNGGAISFN
jgi:hypothetical protein